MDHGLDVGWKLIHKRMQPNDRRGWQFIDGMLLWISILSQKNQPLAKNGRCVPVG